jgi:hypothetical protein
MESYDLRTHTPDLLRQDCPMVIVVVHLSMQIP